MEPHIIIVISLLCLALSVTASLLHHERRRRRSLQAILRRAIQIGQQPSGGQADVSDQDPPF